MNPTTAFVSGPVAHGMFVKSSSPATSPICDRRNAATITMGKKVASFGPFTPAVVAARLVVGEKSLNKFRGKAIAAHSQVISNFCSVTGAGPKARQSLIRQAKKNGNVLGFLS